MPGEALVGLRRRLERPELIEGEPPRRPQEAEGTDVLAPGSERPSTGEGATSEHAPDASQGRFGELGNDRFAAKRIGAGCGIFVPVRAF